jgi:hypothetical protein
VLEVVGCAGAGEHGDGADAAVETGGLLHADGCAGDFEVALAEGDVVESFDDRVDDLVVRVLAECDTLCDVSGYVINAEKDLRDAARCWCP